MKISYRKLFVAVAVAAFYGVTIEDFIPRLRGFWRSLITSGTTKHERQAERLEVCRKCPLFYSRLDTCGSPLLKTPESLDENGVQMGCYCYMPVKATTLCNCWFYDESGGVGGWPARLNDFPCQTSQT